MAAKILFVDDEPLMHQLYKPHVERAGYEWIGVGNGLEAIDVALGERPQLAIIDIQMPGLDGISTVTELKKGDTTRDIPIIVITGEAEYYNRQKEVTMAGAGVFLTKPFGPGQLIEAINKLLSRPPQLLPKQAQTARAA